MSFVQRSNALLAAIALLCTSASAQSPPQAQPTAITNVRLVENVDAPIVSILLRNGRIERILPDGTDVPAEYQRIDGGRGLATPAFIDSYSTEGIETPEPAGERDAMSPLDGNVHVGMRDANRKGLQPAFSAVTLFNLSGDSLEGFRAQGFGVVHGSPDGQILAGQSLVASLREGALRDRVLATDVFMAAEFSASGAGYPSTLMGYLSHLRQFILDAKWQELRLARYADGRLDRRPPFDADLEALRRVLAKEQRLLCHADSARDIRRWLAFAKAQDIHIAICGGGEAWKVAAELKAAEVPVFLSLDWGDEVEDPDKEKDKASKDAKPEKSQAEATEAPQSESAVVAPVEGPESVPAGEPEKPQETTPAETVEQEGVEAKTTDEQSDEKTLAETKEEKSNNWIYEEPIDLRRERRRLWEETRDCALRLHEAQVEFALCTASSTPKQLIENVRALIEEGLSAEVAMSALTTTGATALGLSTRIGKIEAGYDAHIAVWSGSPFAKKSQLHWLIVDGVQHEFEHDEESGEGPEEGVELTGSWTISYSNQVAGPAELALVMQKDGALTGTLTFAMPDGEKSSSKLTGRVSGKQVTLNGSIEMGAFSAKIRLEGQVKNEGFEGDASWKFSGGEDSSSFTATRKPESEKGENS